MEKFSKFRDESTGIAPFLSPKKKSASFNFVLRALLAIYSVITTPLALAGLMVYFLIANLLTFVPTPVTGAITRWILLIPLRLFNINQQYDGENRVSVRQKKLTKPQPGDVILSNFVSPLDPFIYQIIRKSLFVFPTSDGKFEEASVWQVMQRALSAPQIAPKGESLVYWSTKAAKRNATVVVFVEGTTTNGKGLLTLKDLNAYEISKISTNLFASAIKYTPNSIPSVIPTSIISYVWFVSSASWWYLASIKTSGEPIPKANLNSDTVAREIARLGRLRILGDGLDMSAKQKFIDTASK